MFVEFSDEESEQIVSILVAITYTVVRLDLPEVGLGA